MTERHLEGPFLLKSISKDLMVFGIVATIYSIIYLVKPGDGGTGWMVATILLMIASILEFIFGAVGFRKSDDAGSATYFIVTGFISAIVMIISLIMCYSIWNLLGLILPIFYIVGGFLLRKVAD
jgi:hypothetical protein